MDVIMVIRLIALLIFGVSCVTIYHNTNSYEPKYRIVYIIVGTAIMYFITSLICSMNAKGINVKEEALNDVQSVIKLIFTPINSLIVLSYLGNTFGKVKDNVIRNR